jgi:hypothetical protein
MDDAIDDLIQQVHKMKNNFKNITPFETVYDSPSASATATATATAKKEKRPKKFKEEFTTYNLFPGEGTEKLEKLRAEQRALEKEYALLTQIKNPSAQEKKKTAETLKAKDLAKKKADDYEKSLNPSVTFFQSLEPPIKYTKGEKPKFLKLIYMIVVVFFNIPNIILNFIARMLVKILQDSSIDKTKTKTQEEADYEIIRTFLVEVGYLLLTFWITYVLLDYGLETESKIQSKGWFTTFKWVSVSFFTVLGTILWYPTEFFIRVLTTRIGPIFYSLGIDDFPCLKYLLAFFVSIFFVFNFLSKTRSAFFKCFIKDAEMPKASWQVHLLIALAYLSNYMGLTFTNAIMWYFSTITRFLSFIFHIIISHLFAPIAQISLSIALLWYLFFRYLPSRGPPQSKIHEEIYSGLEANCKTDKTSILGQLNYFIGSVLLLKSNRMHSWLNYSCFVFFIWMLFFMYRMQKIELTTDKNIRVLTGVFNGLGIFGCLAAICYIHYKNAFPGNGTSTLEVVDPHFDERNEETISNP